MTKTFLQLINEYRIIIPLIQRDYAQGRIEEKSKANNFLNSILDGAKKGLNLDFIYGKVNEKDKTFIPLDGQQRLTTLLLLHWYLSLENNYVADLNKFSYEVRSSTKDFINKLTQENCWKTFLKKDIKKSIENSSWFFLSWKNDPTVLALLNMLDLIENKFLGTEYKNLSKITFEFLNLNEFNLTDELYVKMNARGKPLTDFENFKSNFEKLIKDEEVKANLDNKWLHIFWEIAQSRIKNEKKEISEAPSLADKMFYNFFYNVTFNFYIENKDKLFCKIDNIDKEFNTISDKKKKNGFIEECSIFDFYNNVYSNSIKIDEVIQILNNLDVDDIFKLFIDKIDISQWDRARFYALSLGYIKNLDKNEFRKWKRVSFNLINNQLIQSPTDLIKTINALKQLSDNCNNNIYTYIKDNSDNIEYFTKIQRNEEALKAKLIENISTDWEYELVIAENNWYLNGQVGFLLDFAGNDIIKFIDYRNKFEALWNFTKDNENKPLKNNQILIYQALLTKGFYLPYIGSNRTFCSFDGNSVRAKFDNWQKLFNSDKIQNSDNPERKKYLKDLLDDEYFNKNNIKDSLDSIVNDYKENDWRNHFIKNVSYIKYCKQLQIRWNNVKKIRLLKTTQINGTHKELYSWDLFHKEFGLIEKEDRQIEWRLESAKTYSPFTTTWYYESTSWNEPCIVLDDFKYDNIIVKLDIGYDDKGFYLSIYTDDEENELPAKIIDIISNIDYNKDNIKQAIKYDDILIEIQNTCNKLEEL